MNEFQSMLPETSDFNIGYLVGKQSTKYWLMCEKDSSNMNEYMNKTKSVMLWCDARVSKESEKADSKRQKRSEDEPPSKRQLIEDELDCICAELKEKHGSKYSIPQFRCWARNSRVYYWPGKESQTSILS